MALITCPECGEKVSDKAKACVHCGYPMESATNQENIKSYGLTLTQILEEKKVWHLLSIFTQIFRGLSDDEVLEKIRKAPGKLIAGLSEDNADWVLTKLHEICTDLIKEPSTEPVDEYLNVMINAERRGDPVCPECGSTRITLLPRGFKGTLYEHNCCQKCGYSWAI